MGNDVLAELLAALALLAAMRWVAPQPGTASDRASWVRMAGLGTLLGLILVTKSTAYIVLPVVLVAMVWRWAAERAPARRIAGELAAVWGIALLIGLPWFARNVRVYGWPDFLGLARHDAVVVGQLRTAEYLAQNGLSDYLRRLVEFTFKSFWGVFGWLGIFMDSRVYYGLALITLLALAGWLIRWRGGPNMTSPENLKRADRLPVDDLRRLGGAAAATGAVADGAGLWRV